METAGRVAVRARRRRVWVYWEGKLTKAVRGAEPWLGFVLLLIVVVRK